MEMKLETGQTLLFIGDSITDAGRAGQFPPFGQGYLNFLRALIMSRRPDLQVKFVNRGIGGNTIRDLASRWDDDALAERPDHLFVMIGINDVSRYFAAAEQREFHVPLEEFLETYERLLQRTKGAGITRIHLCGSFFVEPNRDEPMRKMCDRYNAAVATLAQQHGLPFYDMQAVMDRLLEDQHPVAIAPDRVHPQPHGHLAMADEIYRMLS